MRDLEILDKHYDNLQGRTIAEMTDEYLVKIRDLYFGSYKDIKTLHITITQINDNIYKNQVEVDLKNGKNL